MPLFVFCFLTLGLHCAQALEEKTIVLTSPTQQLELKVEVATTEADHQKGLMFRKNLAEGTGMLFIWQKPHTVNMWMKNTYIPLDMIFLREGQIKHIHKQAVPHSLDIISSIYPVDMVLEVPAGYSDKHQIDLNWQLHERSDPHKADPCDSAQTETCH